MFGRLLAATAFLPLKLAIYAKLKDHEMMEKSISLHDPQPIFGSQTETLYVFDLSLGKDSDRGAAFPPATNTLPVR